MHSRRSLYKFILSTYQTYLTTGICISQIFNLDPILVVYILLNLTTTNMISKLLPSTQFVFRALAFSHFNFNFCTAARNSYINRQPLKLQQCHSIQKIIRYVEEGDSTGAPRQANKEVLKRICLISQRGIQTFFNISTIAKKIDVLDINSVDAETINYICTLYGILSQKYVFSSNFIKSLKDRVLLMLNNPDELSDETLISLIDFSSEIEDAKFIIKACEGLKERIPKFRYVGSFVKLLRYIQKRKTPFHKQRQLFTILAETVQRRMEGIKILQLIKICNSEAWDSWKLKLKIEQKIDENIDNFDEKQFNDLVNFSHPNNKFLSKLHKKIISEINQQGDSEMGSQTILKLLNRCSIKGSKINFKQQDKVLKLILKNLAFINRIKQFLLKDTLYKRNQLKILQKISENEEYRKSYGNDCEFIAELCVRRLYNNQLIKIAVEEVHKNINDVQNDKSKFVYYTILLHKYNKQSGKDVMQIQQIKNKIQDVKSQFSHFSYLKGFKCSYRAIQYFNNMFGSYFLTDIVAAIKEQKITLRSNQLFYFVLTCNNHVIMNLLKKQNVVKQRQVMQLIKKVSMNPTIGIGNFNNINIILTKYMKQRFKKISMHCDLSIRNYLFNQSMQQLLQESQLNLYLSTILQKIQSSKSSIIESLFHSINMPTLLKSSQQYVNFLINIKQLLLQNATQKQKQKLLQQNVSVSENKSQSDNVSVSENKSQKQNTVQFSKIVRFARQLLKYGLLDQQFLNYVKNHGIKQFDGYMQDGLLVDGDDKNVFFYLALFFRNGDVSVQDMRKNLDAVNKVIEKANGKFIQTFLLNFNWKLNQVSLQIIKSLFQKLAKQQTFQKLSRLIQKMSQISYSQGPYRYYIKKIADLIAHMPDKITTRTHISLARQLLYKNIQADEYINGIMFHFDQRQEYYQYDVDKKRALRLIFYLNPNKTFYLIENQCRRNRKKNYWLKLIKIVDFKNQTILKSIKQLFKDLPSIQLDLADFDFIAHNIPEIQQFRSKLQPITFQTISNDMSKQFLEKCCKELNIQYSIVESKGKQAIKIGDKYMAFQIDSNLWKYKAFLKQYYAFTLKTPAQNTFVMINHMRGKSKGTVQFIGQSFPEIPDLKKVYLKYIMINETERRNNNKNKNQNQSESNSESNSESKSNSSSSETKTKDQKKLEKGKDDSWQE